VGNLSIFNFKPARKYRLKRAHVSAFLGILLATFFSLEMANRRFFVPQARAYRILNSFRERASGTEVLFLGDSHFIKMLGSGEPYPKVFNLSFPGASYILSFYMLKSHIQEMPSLRYVVLPLDLHSFSAYRSDRMRPAPFWVQFVDLFEFSKIKGWRVLLYQFSRATILDSDLGRGALWGNFRSLFISKETRKFLSAQIEIKDRSKKNAQSRMRHRLRIYRAFDEPGLIYFKKILTLCQRRGIKVITVQTPNSPEFRKQAAKYLTSQPVKQRVLADPAIVGLIYKHLDYEKSLIDQDEAFYVSGDHLKNAIDRKTLELILKEFYSEKSL